MISMPRKFSQSNNKKCPENGADNGVSRVETAENISKCVVGLTIKTGGSVTDDAPIYVVCVVYSNIPIQGKFYSFHRFEMQLYNSYDSEG